VILQSWRGFLATAGEPVRVGGCFAFAGEPDRLEEVLLYHQDYYEKGEELREEVVLFIWRLLPTAATSVSHVHPPIFMTQINDVFQRFITHMERRHDSAN